jgi:hypothetical protein
MVRGEKSVPIKDFQVDMLLDTPVRLGKLKHVIFGDQVDVFEFDTVFTLFELVEGRLGTRISRNTQGMPDIVQSETIDRS